MDTVEYPSSNFRQTVERLIEKHESFTVFVPCTSNKNPIVRDKLNELSGRRRRSFGRVARIVGTMRIFEFIAALAVPLSGEGYQFKVEDKDDLAIHFTAT